MTYVTSRLTCRSPSVSAHIENSGIRLFSANGTPHVTPQHTMNQGFSFPLLSRRRRSITRVPSSALRKLNWTLYRQIKIALKPKFLRYTSENKVMLAKYLATTITRLSLLCKSFECRAEKGADTWVIFTSLPQIVLQAPNSLNWRRKDSHAIVITLYNITILLL